MTFTLYGQRYDYSYFPLGEFPTERAAKRRAREYLGCRRLKRLGPNLDGDMAYIDPRAEDDDIESAVYIVSE